MGVRIRVLPIILLILLSTGCAAGGPAKKPAPQPPNAAGSENTVQLPWHNDPEFAQAKKEHGTPLLMAEYHATLPDPILDERHNISLAADFLRGAVIKPGEVFSLNSRVGWRSAHRGFKPGPMYSGGRIVSTVGGGVCKIASVIYNVAILANQKIVERHPHSMTVPYVPPGQDATISYGTKDFKFKNTTGAPILIWAKNTGGTLYIAFYGTSKPPHIRWVHETLSRTKTWTERVFDPTLPKGVEKVKYEGSEGISVHSRIVISESTGKEITRDLGVSSYRPSPRLVSVGP